MNSFTNSRTVVFPLIHTGHSIMTQLALTLNRLAQQYSLAILVCHVCLCVSPMMAISLASQQHGEGHFYNG